MLLFFFQIFDGEQKISSIKSVSETPFVSTSGVLILRFRSDGSVQGGGFIASYAGN